MLGKSSPRENMAHRQAKISMPGLGQGLKQPGTVQRGLAISPTLSSLGGLSNLNCCRERAVVPSNRDLEGDISPLQWEQQNE